MATTVIARIDFGSVGIRLFVPAFGQNTDNDDDIRISNKTNFFLSFTRSMHRIVYKDHSDHSPSLAAITWLQNIELGRMW